MLQQVVRELVRDREPVSSIEDRVLGEAIIEIV